MKGNFFYSLLAAIVFFLLLSNSVPAAVVSLPVVGELEEGGSISGTFSYDDTLTGSSSVLGASYPLTAWDIRAYVPSIPPFFQTVTYESGVPVGAFGQLWIKTPTDVSQPTLFQLLFADYETERTAELDIATSYLSLVFTFPDRQPRIDQTNLLFDPDLLIGRNFLFGEFVSFADFIPGPFDVVDAAIVPLPSAAVHLLFAIFALCFLWRRRSIEA